MTDARLVFLHINHVQGFIDGGNFSLTMLASQNFCVQCLETTVFHACILFLYQHKATLQLLPGWKKLHDLPWTSVLKDLKHCILTNRAFPIDL